MACKLETSTGLSSTTHANESRGAERDDPTSLLKLYRRLIDLRRAELALAVGDYAALPSSDDLMTYARKAGERRF